jgi:hypothetical protein
VVNARSGNQLAIALIEHHQRSGDVDALHEAAAALHNAVWFTGYRRPTPVPVGRGRVASHRSQPEAPRPAAGRSGPAPPGTATA